MVFVEIRKRARFIVAPLFAVSLLAYFGYHLVEGDRGLKAWNRRIRDLAEAKGRLAAVEAERRALEQDVALLRPDHIDRDMLDEQARATLNLAAPNEKVIFTKRPER
jgi:cell division protein FtsB